MEFIQQFGVTVPAQGLTTGSQYFQVTSEASLGERRQVLVSYLQRGNDGRVRVLARDLGQSGITPPEPTKESKQ
ncbi:hypothetical protein D3C84_698810 [compost metagenome]